ncbi:MAG: transporter, partial [Flavobacteriaceae bacterium]
TGFGDLRVRASINFTGAPSLEPQDFSSYAPKTVTGLGVQVIIPTGNYKPEQLPNLGSNRWSVRATYGLSRTFEKWVLEGFVGAWFFSDNKEFLVNNTLEQSSLWVLKGNIIRSFNQQGMWLAFSTGYGYGAETYINGVKRDAIISQLRLGLTYMLPLSKKHSLKFSVNSGIRFQEGADFDLFGFSYSYMWLDKNKKKQLQKTSKQ